MERGLITAASLIPDIADHILGGNFGFYANSYEESLPDLGTAVSMTKQEFTAEVRLMAALKMFELGKLSSGKAAQLAGISRVEFFETCGRYQVSIMNYSGDEIEAELTSELS